MKLFAKSVKGNMIKVGDSVTDSKWHFVTTEVGNTLSNFSTGDEIVIETKVDGTNDFITSLSKVGASQPKPAPKPTPKPEMNTGATPDVGVTPQKTGYLPKEEWIAQQKAKGLWNDNKSTDRGTDTNNSIKRQAIANATSRTIVGMNGTVTPDNVIEVMEKIYNKYVELVG